MKRQGISISSILFAHLSCFSLVPLFKRCDTVWCSEERKKKKIVRMNYKSVISTSRLPYTFSLYQIICLLFERVWIESLYSFNVCYVFLSRLSFFCRFLSAAAAAVVASIPHTIAQFFTLWHFCKGHLHDLVYHWNCEKATHLSTAFRSLKILYFFSLFAIQWNYTECAIIFLWWIDLKQSCNNNNNFTRTRESEWDIERNRCDCVREEPSFLCNGQIASRSFVKHNKCISMTVSLLVFHIIQAFGKACEKRTLFYIISWINSSWCCGKFVFFVEQQQQQIIENEEEQRALKKYIFAPCTILKPY